jgi:hypothetical protein
LYIGFKFITQILRSDVNAIALQIKSDCAVISKR